MNNKFFGSKLNTLLLAVLIVLMFIAIHFMLQNKQMYAPIVQNDQQQNIQPVPQPENNNVKSDVQPTKPAQTLVLTMKDNNKAFTISKGDTVKITTGNPGDGGYHFEDVKYDNKILKLQSHTQQAGHVGLDGFSVPGDWGTDTWQFIAIKSGSSIVKLDVIQGDAVSTEENYFTTTVTIK